MFATKSWLTGAVYFVLQDFASTPWYAGGNPFPDPPFNRKGLVDLTGNFKPAFATVAAIYHATVQLGQPVHAFVRRRAHSSRGPSRPPP